MNGPGPSLRDIHPAPSPGWWPLAYGWWLLAAVVVALSIVLVIGLLRAHARRRRLREIDRELERMRLRYEATKDAGELASGLSHWLRRASRLHDAQAVMLEGAAWHGFLREQAPAGMDASVLLGLDEAMYRRQVELDVDTVVPAVRAWIAHAVRGH